jgi:hypothetical protein
MAGTPGLAASDHVPVFFVYIINTIGGPGDRKTSKMEAT